MANPMIRSAGYDAQRQVLEMEFASDGQICQFDNVPEEIWYRFRSHHLPALIFPTFHYGALSGAKNAGNRVENPSIQEILIHRGEYHYGISKYRGKSCGDRNIRRGF